MRNKLHKILTLLVFLLMPGLGGLLTGCSAWDWTCFGLDLAETILDPNDPYYSSCYYSGYYWHEDDDEDDNDDQEETAIDQGDVATITITGDESVKELQYNEDSFEASLDPSTGKFNFSPDPDGAISGASIDCRATIDTTQFTGECFRDSHVCSFSYQRQEDDPEEVYTLIASSCEAKAGLGAFHVPDNASSEAP